MPKFLDPELSSEPGLVRIECHSELVSESHFDI